MFLNHGSSRGAATFAQQVDNLRFQTAGLGIQELARANIFFDFIGSLEYLIDGFDIVVTRLSKVPHYFALLIPNVGQFVWTNPQFFHVLVTFNLKDWGA